jgi:hypothetical protein
MHESSELEYDPIKLKITVTAGVEDFFICDQDIEVYFRGYPNIKNKLNFLDSFLLSFLFAGKCWVGNKTELSIRYILPK